MKTIAVFPAKKEIKIVDHPSPKIVKSTDVKVRILEVGICGTDRDICSFQYGTPPSDSEYLIIGHESLGEVVEVGPEVSRVAVGDLVVITVRRPCPHENCYACRNGRQDFCFTGEFTERGIKEAHGFMTEFVVDDEKYFNRVPSQLRDVAILTEPLTIVEKALIQVWQVQQRLPWGPHPAGQKPGYCHKAVVLGAGPVGLLGVMALLNAGFETYAYSRGLSSSPAASLVTSVGGKYISSDASTPEDLSNQVGNIDLVYEATGAAQISFEVMEVLGINSVMVFTGIPGLKGPLNVDADLIMRNLVLKNQIVLGTVNADRSAFENAVTDLGFFNEKWPQAVRSLITGRYPPESYREVLLGPKKGIKSVFSF
ncbi:MAG: glucose 1-dehydrogenase [Candidatus Omnitrophica bacterium]|nr:glucose 1-dehydrogenase [Candidatus Omnitrophota bacterium]